MKQKKKKKRINRLEIVLFYLIILCLIYTIVPCKKTVEKSTFSIIYEKEDKTRELKQKEKIIEKEVYLSLEDVQNLFGKEMYLDETEKWIITYSETKVVAMNVEEPKMRMNAVEMPMEHPIICEEEQYYLPISVLENVYHMTSQYIEETNTEIIHLKNKELVSADVKRKVQVKSEKKTFSDTIETIGKGESITWVSNEEKGWAKILTKKGNLGYVKQKALTNFYTIRENIGEEFFTQQEEKETTEMKDLKMKKIKLTDIQTYEARESKIEAIVEQCIKKQVSCLEFQDETLEEKDKTSYDRMKKELAIRLKEVGIELK